MFAVELHAPTLTSKIRRLEDPKEKRRVGRAIGPGATAPAGQLASAFAAAGLRPAHRPPANHRYEQHLMPAVCICDSRDCLTREARGGDREPNSFGSSDLRFFALWPWARLSSTRGRRCYRDRRTRDQHE
jgi:hypothetical protein